MVGDIYAAKKSNETKYYRVEVNSKIDNEHFNVCFIDFGSQEIVHKNNIIQLTESQVKTNCLYSFKIQIYFKQFEIIIIFYFFSLKIVHLHLWLA